jgi:hypothetical protein
MIEAIMDATRMLPVEKRDVCLQRIAAMLALRGRGHFGNVRYGRGTAVWLECCPVADTVRTLK